MRTTEYGSLHPGIAAHDADAALHDLTLADPDLGARVARSFVERRPLDPFLKAVHTAPP